MKNLFLILSLAILTFAFSKSLKSQTNCIQYGGDCDFISYCCGNNQCKDYRCALKGTKDNQIGWDKSKKEGNKCDWFHHCKKGRKCMSHRCYDV
jgi:hypothetical protein